MIVAPIEIILHCLDTEPVIYQVDEDHPFVLQEKERILKSVG